MIHPKLLIVLIGNHDVKQYHTSNGFDKNSKVAMVASILQEKAWPARRHWGCMGTTLWRLLWYCMYHGTSRVRSHTPTHTHDTHKLDAENGFRAKDDCTDIFRNSPKLYYTKWCLLRNLHHGTSRVTQLTQTHTHIHTSTSGMDLDQGVQFSETPQIRQKGSLFT